MQELDDFINSVKNLPPAPRVLPQLLALLNDADVDCSRVVELVSLDSSLTASVLQRCNSSFFASGTPADGLDEAVGRIGFRQVYQIVAAVSGSKCLMPAKIHPGLDPGDIWRHSVATAIGSQLVAREVGDDESVAFTAGLMHDIGKTVFVQALDNIYAKLVEEAEQDQQTLFVAEKKRLGVQHAEIGGRLLARWQFPANLVAAVWHHHKPSGAQPHERLAAQVCLGDMIAYILNLCHGPFPMSWHGRDESVAILKISMDALPSLIIQTAETYQSVEAQFQM